MEVAFEKNLLIDAEVIAPHGTVVDCASDAETRLPFWPLLFKNGV